MDRADKHNALSGDMIEQMKVAVEGLAADDAVRVVVLAARGRTFCAGGDLAWMQKQMQATPKERGEEAGKLAWMLQALNTLPKPLIGRVQGNAFGGGLGMASVCDVCIGTPDVQMALTETRLGLIPATIGPYVCARMGEARARRVFMSGRRFGADEAVELGLLARVVDADALDDAIEAEVAPYLSCAPGAVARAKALLRRLGPVIDDDGRATKRPRASARSLKSANRVGCRAEGRAKAADTWQICPNALLSLAGAAKQDHRNAALRKNGASPWTNCHMKRPDVGEWSAVFRCIQTGCANGFVFQNVSAVRLTLTRGRGKPRTRHCRQQ
jgi:methylglutaconyl-CoA hydratase